MDEYVKDCLIGTLFFGVVQPYFWMLVLNTFGLKNERKRWVRKNLCQQSGGLSEGNLKQNNAIWDVEQVAPVSDETICAACLDESECSTQDETCSRRGSVDCLSRMPRI